MNVTVRLRAILDELTSNAALIDEEPLERLVREILDARHVFLAGAGRSGDGEAADHVAEFRSLRLRPRGPGT